MLIRYAKALIVLAMLVACWLPSSLAAVEPLLEKIDLFEGGRSGYAKYHIPCIAVTAKGTVLACCEARRHASDWDAIDILLRRSTDDGRTWSEAKKLADVPGPKVKNPAALRVPHVRSEDVTYNNPVLITAPDGKVHVLFCLEYMRCFYMRSDDDGQSWSAPVEITATFDAFRAGYDWKVLATGPGHGIHLAGGRLVVPIWLSTGTGGNAHRPSITATIFSDDDGATWLPGEVAVPCTAEWVNPGEAEVVELSNGSVMLNARSESPRNRRLVTISKDGATGWSTPAFDDALEEPVCMASLVRYAPQQAVEKAALLFSNPRNLSRADGKEAPGKGRDRQNVSVRVSYDDGRTWPVSKSIEPGPSAYSDLAVSPQGTIFCFYGRSEKPNFAGDRMTVARFNLEWLTSRGE